MSIAAVAPISRAEPAAAPVPAFARIEGAVSQLGRRGKNLLTFDGTNLRKVGVGEVVTITHAGTTYRGDLVAISPARAILHISSSRSDHGIVKG